jgi:hypothetical protein
MCFCPSELVAGVAESGARFNPRDAGIFVPHNNLLP